MFEYFMHFTFYKGISACILITDGTPKDVVEGALFNKYDLSDDEINTFRASIFYEYQPKVIIADTLLIVNGSLRFKGADIMAKKTLLFRCSIHEDIPEDKKFIVLQDNDIYEPQANSIHYKKKILFDKFKRLDLPENNIGMMYATYLSRKLSYEQIQNIVDKYPKFDKFVYLTDKEMEVPDKVELNIVPVPNLWSLFSAYIYTDLTPGTIDCSPRFVAECDFYGKELIIETTVNRGLEVRLHDINNGGVWLKEDDDISNRI